MSAIVQLTRNIEKGLSLQLKFFQQKLLWFQWRSKKRSSSRIFTAAKQTTWMLATIAACSSKNNLEKLDPPNLTHKHLLKQSCSLAVNSAMQLITLTVAAIIDENIRYRASIDKLIGLIEVSLEVPNMSSYQVEVWDEVIAARAEMEDLKKACVELSTFMEYVEKTAMSAAETAFLGGAEYASTAMCERITSAQQQVHEVREKNSILENELLRIQQSHIYATAREERRKRKENTVA